MSLDAPPGGPRTRFMGSEPATREGSDPSAPSREPDVTVKRAEDLERFYHGSFARLRAGLGISAFGIQLITLSPNSDIYPEHNHRDNGHEEVYVALRGRATLAVGSQEYTLEPGVFIRVGPDETRKVITQDEPAEFIVVGGAPGRAYSPPPYTNLGAALAVLSASPVSVPTGEEIRFDGSDSTSGDGTGEITFDWDFEGNGSFVAGESVVFHAYDTPGTYDAVLRITDDAGQTDSDKIRIEVRGLSA